jgi:hypothetical protein
MNAKLFDALMSDLSDPEKTTPQLYKVVLDVLKENRDQVELTDRNVDEIVSEKIDLPFKFGG